MSRIGKAPITVPAGVQLSLSGSTLKVKGAKGELSFELPQGIEMAQTENILRFKRDGDEPQKRSLHGLTRAHVLNMIKGVSAGFEKRLEIIGVGYRAQAGGKKITLNLGYSHPIEFQAPAGISIDMDKEQKNVIIVSGIDRQKVGQVASYIRGLRPPEPYLGKGIRYVGETVVRKAGKAAAGAAAAKE